MHSDSTLSELERVHDTYSDERGTWDVHDLHAAAAGLDVEDLEIELLVAQIGENPWGDLTLMDFAEHLRRCLVLDRTAPIVLCPLGRVMDGYHRIALALAEGRASVPSVQLTVLPPTLESRYSSLPHKE